MRWRGSGQALVEMALILPILLTLLLGGATVGILLIDRMQLAHAAIEGADSGASFSSVRQRCPKALSTAAAVLGRTTAEASCRSRGGLVEVSLGERLPLLVPFVGDSWWVRVTERSSIR